MNYDKTQAIMDKIAEKGSIYGLEAIENLLELLENPQDELSFVHVAGTNGKGSVIAYLTGVLVQAGYRTGQFTSPAVFSKRESISINSKQISEKDYTNCLEKIFECIEIMKKKGERQPTAFEIETALAFLYFKMKKCDIVLLETGLGGDSDATNIIKNPLCSVIMPVSLDHTNLLGDTLSQIAIHKAGIIKDSSPVVSSYQEEVVKSVLKAAADKKKTNIVYTSEYEIIEKSKNIVFDSDFCQNFIYNGNKYAIAMPGIHQIENAITAIEVVGVLRSQGFDISEKNLYDGLATTKWQGRFTVINRKPYIIIDGAHNVSAALRLKAMLEEYIYGVCPDKPRKVVMVAGMLSDKDYSEVIPIVAHKCTKLLTVNTKLNNRGMSGEVLFDVAAENDISVAYMDDVNMAVCEALSIAGENDVVLAFGSFTFLAEFKKCVEDHIQS